MNKLKRREFLKTAAAMPLVWSGIAPLSALAQNNGYPTQPLTLTLPAGAGDTLDLIGRLIAQHLGESLGQPVIIENRPGAGGVSAVKRVIDAKPDGYTMLYMGAGAAISQSLFNPPPFDIVNNLTPITTFSSNDVLLLVRNQSPFTGIDDFLRESGKVKGGLMVGISMLGTIQHMSAELFKLRSKTDMTIVPFKTASAVSTALSAGEIDLAFEFIPAMLSQVRAGRLRALAITNEKRSDTLPDVPTLNELGLKGFHVASWGMFVAPAGTPDAIIQRLNKEVHAVMAKPEVSSRFTDLGGRINVGTSTQAHDLVVSEVARWKDVINEAKISLK